MNKSTIILFFIVSISLFAANSNVYGATLEVGPSQTYTTIQSALNSANPNDVINVHSGIYAEILTIYDDGITLQNYSMDSPTINGRITVGAKNNVTISGLEITGWTQEGMHGVYQDGGTGLTVKNNKIHNGPSSGSASCVYSRNSTRTTISGNDIYNCRIGVNIVSGHSTDATSVNGILISSNIIHDNPADGIDLHGEYITIDNNIIYNNLDTDWINTHPDGIQLIASTVDGYTTVKHAVIRRNIIRNHTQNIFTEGTLSDELSNCEDVHIYSNIIYNESQIINGVDMDSLSNSNIVIKYSKNVFIYNNTLGRAGNNAIYVQQNANGTIHIKNNIINNNLRNGIYIQDAADVADNDLDYNLYHNKQAAVILGTTYYLTASMLFSNSNKEKNGKDGDPKINVWPEAALLPGSLAIDSGISLGVGYNVDKYGNIRSGLWDIGAYEVIRPSPPQDLIIQ